MLDRGKQGVVAAIPVVGEPQLRREHGQLQRLAADRRGPRDLFDRGVDVVDGDLVRDDESLRVDRRELAQARLNARRLLPPVLDEVQVPERFTSQ